MSKRAALIFRFSLLGAMCLVIFVFSSFSAEGSSAQSSEVVELIVDSCFKDIESYPAEKQEELTSMLTVTVRKGAHFSEYALLCMLAFSAFFEVKRRFPRWLLAVLFSFVYACTDEFHQLFVPGRAGMWSDVLIDTSGAVLGGAVACIISVTIAARRRLREDRG